jgi:hypothetical protein
MTGCGIGARGAMRIGEMLGKNTSLKTIDLSCEIQFNNDFPSILMQCVWYPMFIHGRGMVDRMFDIHGVVCCVLDCSQ